MYHKLNFDVSVSILFLAGTKVLDMVQNVKFSSEALFMIQSKMFWTDPKQGPKSFWTYSRTRQNNFLSTFEIKILLDNNVKTP